jgi:hypothetical protein
MTAAGAFLAGVLWWHGKHLASSPELLYIRADGAFRPSLDLVSNGLSRILP